MSVLKYKNLWWLLGILGLGLILVGSLIPSEPGPQIIPHIDKLLHFIGYGLACFYFQQLCQNKKTVLVFLLILLYSALMEFLQDLTPSRQMSSLDMLANFLGCLVGSFSSKNSLPNFLVSLDKTLQEKLQS